QPSAQRCVAQNSALSALLASKKSRSLPAATPELYDNPTPRWIRSITASAPASDTDLARVRSTPLLLPNTHQSPRLAARLGGLVTRLQRIGLGHVFTLLGLAVVSTAFLVVDAAVGVNPHHALCRRRARRFCGSGLCRGC